jgi:hypothetical protein
MEFMATVQWKVSRAQMILKGTINAQSYEEAAKQAKKLAKQQITDDFFGVPKDLDFILLSTHTPGVPRFQLHDWNTLEQRPYP